MLTGIGMPHLWKEQCNQAEEQLVKHNMETSLYYSLFMYLVLRFIYESKEMCSFFAAKIK